MTLKNRIHTEPAVTVLELDGEITLGEASGSLRDAVKNIIASGARNILIDLGGVRYIDSAGLGELVGAYATAENKGVTVKLLNLQKKVEGLMQITRLITVFEVFEDESEAIRSFERSSASAVNPA